MNPLSTWFMQACPHMARFPATCTAVLLPVVYSPASDNGLSHTHLPLYYLLSRYFLISKHLTYICHNVMLIFSVAGKNLYNNEHVAIKMVSPGLVYYFFVRGGGSCPLLFHLFCESIVRRMLSVSLNVRTLNCCMNHCA